MKEFDWPLAPKGFVSVKLSFRNPGKDEKLHEVAAWVTMEDRIDVTKPLSKQHAYQDVVTMLMENLLLFNRPLEKDER